MTTTATYNKTTWFSNYPESWKVLRIKNIFSEIEDRSTSGNEELLSVSHYTGVTLKKDSLENEDDFISNAESLEGYKRVAKGDLVINIMLAWNGSLGISPFDGITSPAYCVYRVKPNNNPKYFGYLFSTDLMKAEFRKKSTGIIDSRLRLYSDKFFSISSVVPPLEEQNQIVEYIEKKSQKINHFIAKKQEFIALLKEQKKSVINEVVTKGIDKNVQLKDSGIKWLGSIPEHWKLRKLRYCGQCQNGLNKGGEFFGAGYPFVGYGDVYNNEVLPSITSGLVMASEEDRINYSVEEGDVFFTRTSEIVDEIAIASTCFETIEDSTFSGFLIRFRPFKKILDKAYSTYYFRCQILRSYFVKEMNIITRASMSQDLLKNLPILIPPMEEQIRIAMYVKAETATIDKAIAKTEREIELIKEYKKALIAEAVVGKINVSKSVTILQTKVKAQPTWEFKEAVLISVLAEKFGSAKFPLGRKRYTKFSYLFHRHTDNKTEGYLKKAAGPYNPKTKYGGPEKIALQNKYIAETQNGNLSGFVASDKIQEAKNYFEHYWSAESLNWLEQLRYKKNDELELYATVDKAMVEINVDGNLIDLTSVKRIIEENPEWKPKLERDIFSDENITTAIEFLNRLFA